NLPKNRSEATCFWVWLTALLGFFQCTFLADFKTIFVRNNINNNMIDTTMPSKEYTPKNTKCSQNELLPPSHILPPIPIIIDKKIIPSAYFLNLRLIASNDKSNMPLIPIINSISTASSVPIL
ncbi:MAG: hypothetical protein ACC657_18360, partial [Thiohalomonadales bacterium]